jgi:hypothetical protein
MRSPRAFVPILAGLTLVTCANMLAAAVIEVPNGSFESPYLPMEAPYATSDISDWQKAPAPGWWLGYGYSAQQWAETAGVFVSVPASPIDNIDGRQAAFLFATPDVELFQDLDVQFEVGQAYDLVVAMQGGGNPTYTPPMRAGVTLEIRLYYRDDSQNRVAVGSTVVTNPEDNYTITNLSDYQLHVPAVTAQDAWAGRNIGVQLISTLTLADLAAGKAGGFWDIDNVRLSAVPEPTSLALLALGVLGLLRRRR